MSQSRHSVSIVIVTCDSGLYLDRCLRSLLTAVADLPCEVVVVDNDSRDNPEPVLRAVFPEASFIHNRTNLGFAGACNRGARQADGEYLLFVNPDVEVDPMCLANLLAVAEKTPCAGLVGARLTFADGRFQPSARRFPTVRNLLFSRGSFLVRGLGRSPLKGSPYTLPDFAEVTEVPALAGTLVLVRRETYLQIGGFDERFFMFMEDTDLCLRLNRAGYTNLFVPKAAAVHHWGRGGSAGKLQRAWYHHRSLWQYFRKHSPNLFSLVVLPFLLACNLVLVSILPDRRGDVGQA